MSPQQMQTYNTGQHIQTGDTYTLETHITHTSAERHLRVRPDSLRSHPRPAEGPRGLVAVEGTDHARVAAAGAAAHEGPWPARGDRRAGDEAVSYTHLRAHETVLDLVCRLLLEKKNTSV